MPSVKPDQFCEWLYSSYVGRAESIGEGWCLTIENAAKKTSYRLRGTFLLNPLLCDVFRLSERSFFFFFFAAGEGLKTRHRGWRLQYRQHITHVLSVLLLLNFRVLRLSNGLSSGAYLVCCQSLPRFKFRIFLPMVLTCYCCCCC